LVTSSFASIWICKFIRHSEILWSYRLLVNHCGDLLRFESATERYWWWRFTIAMTMFPTWSISLGRPEWILIDFVISSW
jgi:hypothetical protein